MARKGTASKRVPAAQGAGQSVATSFTAGEFPVPDAERQVAEAL